ncbi:LINE-1 reverse transcriptase-like [Vitis vinifera]|uniref:LINE-1 reverse transcriptase-like n=1 Tax=Vitis vinifera TaxID=29760 RepID=A0A438J180_VITVI|nr:LINE-1 reverse transcriptase-like [Vitis vinifera]
MKVCSPASPLSSSESNTEEEILKIWETEDLRKRNMKILHSATDSTLVEEALRYGSVPLLRGKGILGLLILFLFLLIGLRRGSITIVQEMMGWSLSLRGEEWGSGLNDLQAVRGEKEEIWEESSLAKFSHFLGFSTEGLEKEILDFLIKIRKRMERIHDKVLLEKSKFERELKRLECSVNYEKGRKQKDPSQGNKNPINVGGGGEKFRFKNVDNGTVWVFTGVYGPFTKEERECLWEEIGAIRGLWEDPWCVGGDFNITLFQRERSRQGRITSAMRRFAQIADELGLRDIPMQGGVFTWSGGPNNQSWARLDRFLVNTSWLDQFSSVLQSRLSRPLSDHFPWWEIEVRGSASFRLATKLKEIKQKLKVWNKEVFGNLGCNKAAALQQMEFWDRVESERILSMEETELKKEAKENYKKWVLLEETHWRQLSREIWLREGDRNTGYFHHMANANRRNNYLDRIKIDGVSLSEEQEVRKGVANAYQQMLSKESGWQADIGRLRLEQISQQDAENLESPFSEAEVHSALMEMNGDKTPGPDGFTVAFWQSCWDFVKEEILAMFKEFHEQNTFLKSLNNTFLVLIPKKVLANRLKKVIGKVVSPAQNAFVMGRQILDASLIANEVIDLWQKRKEKGVICKLDIEKAYDSLNWQFLMKVLQKMGFGQKWLGWMWSCISSAKFSVLVNGVPTGFFPSTKGLRQGDPLSPYLFVMGMEVLGILIRRAVEGGFLSGCSIREGGRTALNISHLFFADDTIIFCEANKEHLSHLSWVLFWFEAASGLKINLSKSEIIPVGEVDDIEELAVELGCRVGSLPSQYLGLPLGVPNKASLMWDGVKERVRRRLTLWKRQFISKSGRITLIKSTLASIPIYQMPLFRMPKIVIRRLEKLQRDFLWGGGNMERKVHLVKWEIVCGDKGRGGLGLRKLGLLNKALLGKWIWRYACERENLWKQVILAKFGQEEHGWRSKKPSGAFGVGVWKEIMKETDWCWDNLKFMVGKGTRIRFWTDVWCAGTALSQSFPHLFALAANRNATVEEMWDHNSEQGGWNLRFLRNFNDWEVGMVGDLLLKLRGLRPSLEEDSVSWKGGKNGKFKVKKAYSCLVNHIDTAFPEKCIWVDSVPTKVAFFAWEATWEKVLTLDRLQRRGWQFPNCCFLCGCAEESINHILIHCIVVRALWELVLGLLGVKWAFPETVKEVLFSWRDWILEMTLSPF